MAILFLNSQMKKLALSLVLFLFFASHGFSQDAISQASQLAKNAVAISEYKKLKQNKKGNFTLHVSNQSFYADPVDIKVMIDGKLAVDQDFYVRHQHNWITFRFNLADGEHTLHVVSFKGEATLTQRFEVVGKNWAVIDYFYYPLDHQTPQKKQFTFLIQDKPIGFE